MIVLVLWMIPLVVIGQSERRMSFYFKTGSAELTANQERKIQALQKKADYKYCWLFLHGFTDEEGSQASNMDLAQRRVQTVYNIIGGDGFLKAEEHYYGEDSTTHQLDSLNRRVDIVIQRYDELFAKKPMRLRNVLFVNAEYIFLNEEAEESIARLAEILKENSEMRIMIEGHVCCNPNPTLSVNRAIKVANCLIDLGIDKKRLEWQGFSNTRPAAKEISDGARQRNRRVEVRVID